MPTARFFNSTGYIMKNMHSSRMRTARFNGQGVSVQGCVSGGVQGFVQRFPGPRGRHPLWTQRQTHPSPDQEADTPTPVDRMTDKTGVKTLCPKLCLRAVQSMNMSGKEPGPCMAEITAHRG